MKNYFFLIISSMVFFSSCLQDDCTSTRTFTIYDPVTVHVSEFRQNSINVLEKRELENPGKIYFYQNYLLVNEQGRGIHFYDIEDRKNPTQVAFYEIAGNFDMAINNNQLFVDNVIDLVSIDISSISNPKITNRVENYRNRWEPEDEIYWAYSVKSERQEVIDCSNANFGNNFFTRDNIFFANSDGANPFIASSETAANGSFASGGGAGVGGSFARFTIAKDHLYTIDNSDLMTWNISTGKLEQLSSNNMGWGIETIFPFKNHLFIGSNSGLFIFDNSNPVRPVQIASFAHARACDPVVVNDSYAYVTLRDGSTCQGFVNQLDVIDITEITKPKLIESYSMKNPHGLSIVNDKLYVGEGSYGIKVLDVSDPKDISESSYDKDILTYDVIALSEKDLFIVGDNGFYLAETIGNKVNILSNIESKSK